jgi:hypothetical protein
MQLQIQEKADIPFFIQQLRYSEFKEPMTQEKHNYNLFLASLIDELHDWSGTDK